MGRVRRRYPYVAGQLWATLKRNPGSTARELATRLQWTMNRTSTRLRDLKKLGHVRHGGQHQMNTLWYTVGDVKPHNMSGSHPNSLATLQVMHVDWRAKLEMAFVAMGRDPSCIGKGKPRGPTKFEECALASCWTMPNSPTQAGD